MSTKYYESLNHVYYSDNGDNVYIKPAAGQTLYVDGVSSGNNPGGLTTQVQYNDGGVFGAASDFTYTPGVLAIPQVNSDVIIGPSDTDAQGYNELTLKQAQIANPYPAQGVKLGESVGISDTATDIYAVGGVFDVDKGGALPFVSLSGVDFTSYSSILTETTFTTTDYGEFSSINETGDIITFSTQPFVSPVSYVIVFARSGSTWSRRAAIPSLVSKASGATRIFVSDITNLQTVFKWSGSAYLTEQVLSSGGAGVDLAEEVAFTNEDTICSNLAGNIRVWTRVSTTWTLIQTIATGLGADIIDLDAVGTTMTICTVNNVYIYERPTAAVTEIYTLVNTFPITGITSSCTNSTYVFVTDATTIYIYSKIAGVWTVSVNTTALSGATQIRANSTVLVIGQNAGNGAMTFYDITAYVNTPIALNTITLNDGITTDLTMTSLYGSVKILKDTEFTGVVSSLSPGTLAIPNYSNSHTQGFYGVSSTELGVSISGSNKLTIGSTQVVTDVPYISTGAYSNFSSTVSNNGYLMLNGDTAQSIAATTTTLVNSYWGSSVTGGDADKPTYGSGIITINKTGRYLLDFNVIGTFTPAGGSFSCFIVRTSGGVTNLLYKDQGGLTSTRFATSGSIVMDLLITDTLKINCYSTVAVPLNIATYPGHFGVYRIG